MTRQGIDSPERQLQIPHCSKIDATGLLLSWNQPDAPAFSVYCREKLAQEENTTQAQLDKQDPAFLEKAHHLDRILTEAYSLAVERWGTTPSP